MAEKMTGTPIITGEEIYLKQDLCIKGDKGDIYVPTVNDDPNSENYGLITWELMNNPPVDDIAPANILGPEGKVFKPMVDANGNISWTLEAVPDVPVTTNIKGPRGFYFTPTVSVNGVISWSNNGGLDNPSAVNITGPRGYHFYPTVDANGNISWTNTGDLENPATVNIRGPQGFIFTPSVSADGILTWTNNGKLTNPSAVDLTGPQGPSGTIQIGTVTTGAPGTNVSVANVGTAESAVLNISIPRGDKGDKGDGIHILGSYSSVDVLNTAHPSGSVGDSYMINGEMYTWDEVLSTWVSAGQIQGPVGYVFTPTLNNGVLSWTNNGGLENPIPVDLKGPKGDKGDPLTYSDMTSEEKTELKESVVADMGGSLEDYATIKYVNELMTVEEAVEI